MACCTKAQIKVKKVAVKKATKEANKLAKLGKLPQPKPKIPQKDVPPRTKTKPCTLCGKNAAKKGKP
jgi:hypothetical protein